MSRSIITLFVAFVFGAMAVSATPTASPFKRQELTECVLTCTESSLAAGGCTSITDVDCLCSSTDFQAAAKTCIDANCTHDDLLDAEVLEYLECGFVSY